MDIILIGRAAEAGSMEHVSDVMEKYRDRYPADYLRRGISALEISFADMDCIKQVERYCEYVYPVNRESIFTALWHLGEELDSGFRVELSKIAISQFCIELAENADENPYLWDSTGCILAVSDSSARLVAGFKERGIEAEVIGYITEDNIRGVISEGRMTFLGQQEGI